MKTTAMKTAYVTILALAMTASYAFAGGASLASEGFSFLTIFFIGFVALVVVFQLVPAVTLLFGMVKALLSKGEEVKANSPKH